MFAIILNISAIVVAIVAVGVAYFTYRALNKQTQSTILLSCLEIYISLRELRKKAELEKSEEYAERYYRELLDLCWTEFRLWQGGLLSLNVFHAWMASRKRSYSDKHGITVKCSRNQGTLKITQRSVWDELVKKNYFDSDDDFVEFMRSVFDSDRSITKTIKKYKKPKKL